MFANAKKAVTNSAASNIPLAAPTIANMGRDMTSETKARTSKGTLSKGPPKTSSVPGLFPATHMSAMNAAIPATTHKKAMG